MILDGLGDSIDGTVDEISNFLYERLTAHGQTEVKLSQNCEKVCHQVTLLHFQVTEPEFVRFCVLDPQLGDSVVRIFRAMIRKYFFFSVYTG